jgi:hypothetical protein
VCEAERGQPCLVQIAVVHFECHLERKNLADEEKLDSIPEDNAVAFMNESGSPESGRFPKVRMPELPPRKGISSA